MLAREKGQNTDVAWLRELRFSFLLDIARTFRQGQVRPDLVLEHALLEVLADNMGSCTTLTPQTLKCQATYLL